MIDIETTYKNNIAAYLNADANQIFLYWKGRVALYAQLKAMNVGKEDEVILPAFTCVVVANAILYLGAKPVYVDIDLSTYNSRFEDITKAVTSRTKVIICQNTFGLSTDMEKITTFAKEQHIFTIEDCTHGFGGFYNQKNNGTFCDVAFYSTQWNKPFSTGTGGFALVNNEKLLEPLHVVNQDLITPTFKHRVSLKLLYFVREKLLNKHTYWLLVKLFRFLSRHNLVLGSSSGEEIISIKMPPDYFMKLSQTQIKKGIKNICKLQANLLLRKNNAQIYSEYLKNKGKYCVSNDLFENHSFLKYPLLVKNKGDIFRLAEKHRIELGDWFCSPLHPVKENLELWKLDLSQYSHAVYASRHIINLPTDTKKIEDVLHFLQLIEANIL